MKNPDEKLSALEREKDFLAKLRRRPELLERFAAILELTQCADGELRTADAVEELLIEEVRRLGNRVMVDWAGTAEERVAGELRQAVPRVRLRKKKL
jgi:hypothetical protein